MELNGLGACEKEFIHSLSLEGVKKRLWFIFTKKTEKPYMSLCLKPKNSIFKHKVFVLKENVSINDQKWNSLLNQNKNRRLAEFEKIWDPTTQKKQTPIQSTAIEKIDGDGHCLFRSIGYGLCNLHAEGFNIIPILQSRKLELEKTDQALSKKIGDLISILPSAKGNKENALKLIWLLRDIACTYYEKDEEFFDDETFVSYGGKEQYFSKMRNTHEQGTGVELSSLATVLGVKIGVVKDGSLQWQGENSNVEIKINYTGNNINGHYDLFCNVSPKKIVSSNTEAPVDQNLGKTQYASLISNFNSSVILGLILFAFTLYMARKI